MSTNAIMQPFIFWPILTPIGYLLYQNIGFQLRRRRFEKIHGCLPVAKLPQIERILGVDILVENLRCFNRKCLMARLKRRFEQFGNTYSVTIAGISMIYTIEPENIKAVWSTQFDDFGVGWLRRRVTAPTTGEFLLNADLAAGLLMRPSSPPLPDCPYVQSSRKQGHYSANRWWARRQIKGLRTPK